VTLDERIFFEGERQIGPGIPIKVVILPLMARLDSRSFLPLELLCSIFA